jgi:hypothetical protein
MASASYQACRVFGLVKEVNLTAPESLLAQTLVLAAILVDAALLRRVMAINIDFVCENKKVQCSCHIEAEIRAKSVPDPAVFHAPTAD